MPSAFVRRANPKFGVEKEEGGRKGVIFRGSIGEKRWRKVLPCITWADSLRRETAPTLPTSDKHMDVVNDLSSGQAILDNGGDGVKSQSSSTLALLRIPVRGPRLEVML